MTIAEPAEASTIVAPLPTTTVATKCSPLRLAEHSVAPEPVVMIREARAPAACPAAFVRRGGDSSTRSTSAKAAYSAKLTASGASRSGWDRIAGHACRSSSYRSMTCSSSNSASAHSVAGPTTATSSPTDEPKSIMAASAAGRSLADSSSAKTRSPRFSRTLSTTDRLLGPMFPR